MFAFSILVTIFTDVFVGRHRMMVVATVCVWLSLMATTLVLSLLSYFKLSSAQELVWQCISLAWVVSMSFGRLLFESNVVQFGADQLPEGSSDELSSFVHWYVFSEFTGQALGFGTGLVLQAVCPKLSVVIHGLVISLGFVLLLATIAQKGIQSLLIKDPLNTQIIHECLSYLLCCKWKRSRHESYGFSNSKGPTGSVTPLLCEAKPLCSRVELFEDVKTFARVLKLILILCLLTAIQNTATENGLSLMIGHTGLKPVISEAMSIALAFVVFDVYVLLHEFVFVPFFRRYALNILKRLWVSALLYCLGSIATLVIGAYGHTTTPSHNATCLFHEENNPSMTLSISPFLLIIPCVFGALGDTISLIAIFEFILAQSPCALRGLIFGVYFSLVGLGFMLGYILTLPFRLINFGHVKSITTTDALKLNNHQLGKSHGGIMLLISCGSVYFLMCVVLGVLGLAGLTVMVCRYKYRQRRTTRA